MIDWKREKKKVKKNYIQFTWSRKIRGLEYFSGAGVRNDSIYRVRAFQATTREIKIKKKKDTLFIIIEDESIFQDCLGGVLFESLCLITSST